MELKDKQQYTTQQKLQIIANALNKKMGEEIDFNKYQCRVYLAYDYNSKFITQLCRVDPFKAGGVIYCLHKDFRKIALEKIGEEELEKYLKE